MFYLTRYVDAEQAWKIASEREETDGREVRERAFHSTVFGCLKEGRV